jgi:hypothetical protein
MIPWEEIKREYLTGVQPRELVKKHGVNYSTLTSKITREGWKTDKEKISQKLHEKVATMEAVEIQQMREQERKHSDVIVKAILNKLIKNGEINPALDSTDINSLTNAYEKIQRIKYKSYGISDKIELNGGVNVIYADNQDKGL